MGGGGGGANTTKTGNLQQHRYCNTGVFLGTKTTFFLFFCPLHPRYVNKKKKSKKKWRESIYLYFCTEETHEPRHYWCSVYTQTRCRESRLFELRADFILLRRKKGGVFFFFLSFHNTLDTSWEHRKYMEKVL